VRKRAVSTSDQKTQDRKAIAAAVTLPKPRPIVEVPTKVASLADDKGSFEGVLSRVLGFARAAELEGKARPRAAAKAAPAKAAAASKVTATKTSASKATASKAASVVAPASPSEESHSPLEGLRLFVQSLDAQTLDKLRTLMRAGHDARALAEAHVTRHDEDVAPVAKSEDLFAPGMTALQDLQRGHAIACATQFDLELEVTKWSKSEGRGSLDERVWLRFGRELAQSSPADWSCLGALGPGDQLEALYLRRGEERWWSFGSVVDRPSTTQVARERTQKVRKHHKLVPLAVEAVVGRRCRADRRAVRRAALAMSARLGFCRASSGDLTPRA